MNELKLVEWGENCKAWFLLDKENICVVREEMPPNTSEVMHFHRESEQYFYVLSGKLSIIINNELHTLDETQAIFISKGTPHKVFNGTDKNVEFMLFATPNPQGDRVEL